MSLGELAASSWARVPPHRANALPHSIGVLFGLASSLITAYHAILIKRSLPIVDGSALRMAYYCNIFSALCMVPVILITGEFAGVHAVATGKTDARTLIFGTILTVSRAFDSS